MGKLHKPRRTGQLRGAEGAGHPQRAGRGGLHQQTRRRRRVNSDAYQQQQQADALMRGIRAYFARNHIAGATVDPSRRCLRDAGALRRPLAAPRHGASRKRGNWPAHGSAAPGRWRPAAARPFWRCGCCSQATSKPARKQSPAPTVSTTATGARPPHATGGRPPQQAERRARPASARRSAPACPSSSRAARSTASVPGTPRCPGPVAGLDDVGHLQRRQHIASVGRQVGHHRGRRLASTTTVRPWAPLRTQPEQVPPHPPGASARQPLQTSPARGAAQASPRRAALVSRSATPGGRRHSPGGPAHPPRRRPARSVTRPVPGAPASHRRPNGLRQLAAEAVRGQRIQVG